MSQAQVAAKAGLRRELVMRAELGENVGVHHILAIIDAVNGYFDVKKSNASEVVVVENFDEFYQKEFREPIEAEMRSHQSGEENVAAAGLFSGDEAKSKLSADLEGAWRIR